jgi:hypothetical protein
MDNINTQHEINKYKKFKKVDGATYRKVNQFLRKRTYITAREWALARLCTDFRTSGGAEMTFIGKNLPELVPFMEESYSPQAVNQARNSFKKKVRKSSATFFYGAMCGFFTTDELDDLLFEASEVARFLLEVEGTTLDIDEEIDIEDRITKVMRSVGEAAKTILKKRGEDNESSNTTASTDTVNAAISHDNHSLISEKIEHRNKKDPLVNQQETLFLQHSEKTDLEMGSERTEQFSQKRRQECDSLQSMTIVEKIPDGSNQILPAHETVDTDSGDSPSAQKWPHPGAGEE